MPHRTGSGCWPPPGSSSLSRASRSLSTTSLDTPASVSGPRTEGSRTRASCSTRCSPSRLSSWPLPPTIGLADPDPWHGLVGYLERSLALQLRDKGLAQIVSGDRISVEQHDWNREVMAPKNRALIGRARDAGMLRDDVEGTDLTFIQVGLNAIMTRSRHAHPDLYRRYLYLMLDGLRAEPGNPTPLPVAALTSDQTHAVMAPTTTRRLRKSDGASADHSN